MRWIVVLVVTLGVCVAPTASAEALDPTVQRVFELTNAERAKAGLPPLALSDQLNAAAQSYTQVLATSGCFEHTCGPVPNMADRLGRAGYGDWTAIGENIAAGYRTPETVMAGWMASPGHRSNILSPKYTEIGIGMVSGGALGMYWTEDFGARTQPAIAAPLPEVDVAPAADVAPEGDVVPADEAPPDQGEVVPADLGG